MFDFSLPQNKSAAVSSAGPQGGTQGGTGGQQAAATPCPAPKIPDYEKFYGEGSSISYDLKQTSREVLGKLAELLGADEKTIQVRYGEGMFIVKDESFPSGSLLAQSRSLPFNAIEVSGENNGLRAGIAVIYPPANQIGRSVGTRLLAAMHERDSERPGIQEHTLLLSNDHLMRVQVQANGAGLNSRNATLIENVRPHESSFRRQYMRHMATAFQDIFNIKLGLGTNS